MTIKKYILPSVLIALLLLWGGVYINNRSYSREVKKIMHSSNYNNFQSEGLLPSQGYIILEAEAKEQTCQIPPENTPVPDYRIEVYALLLHTIPYYKVEITCQGFTKL